MKVYAIYIFNKWVDKRTKRIIIYAGDKRYEVARPNDLPPLNK